VQPEGLCKGRIPLTVLRMEPVTFRQVS